MTWKSWGLQSEDLKENHETWYYGKKQRNQYNHLSEIKWRRSDRFDQSATGITPIIQKKRSCIHYPMKGVVNVGEKASFTDVHRLSKIRSFRSPVMIIAFHAIWTNRYIDYSIQPFFPSHYPGEIALGRDHLSGWSGNCHSTNPTRICLSSNHTILTCPSWLHKSHLWEERPYRSTNRTNWTRGLARLDCEQRASPQYTRFPSSQSSTYSQCDRIVSGIDRSIPPLMAESNPFSVPRTTA